MTDHAEPPAGAVTPTDAAMDLEAAERLAGELLRRADELHHIGRQLTAQAARPQWRCARADRFREAMQARRTEADRLAAATRELGLWLRAQAAATTPTTPNQL